MSSWDPAQYLQYGDERLRPALDLLARIPASNPNFVIDLGCGAGNVARLLKTRWPTAEVLGVDGSADMLARAPTDVDGLRFERADISTWTPRHMPDVLYSNAALHWLGEHAALFPRLLGCIAPAGWFAVQMPAMHDAPLRRLQSEVAAHGRWAGRLSGVGSAPDILDAGAYWDLLRPHCRTLDIWQTTYLHALSGEDAVAQWAMGSSLRPFLDALPSGEREDFTRTYAEAVRPHYPRRADGTTLLPFRRLFILAQR
jgi:trans-aconitate 2-methyltransferase